VNEKLSKPALRSKRYITNLQLMLFGLGTALFSRVFAALKLPSTINFLHFIMVPLACVSVLINSRSKDRKQIAISKSFLLALFLLLIVVLASALFNQAGIINAVLDYLLLTEPFILILTIVSIPMTANSYKIFRDWILQACLINLIFAYVQYYVFHMEKLEGEADNIKGVFIGQGAGHVIGGSVSMTFAIYYLVNAKNKPLWFRIAIVAACLNHVFISDTKQVLLAFIVGYVILYFSTFKNMKKVILYFIIGAIFSGVFYWAIHNFEFLSPYQTWIRPEIYGEDGEATRLKFATFRIVPQYFHSPLNWWLGLGPGHTVGRLGGWMLPTYWNLFGPLGATIHPSSVAIWTATAKSWLGDQSSMFSPLFGWAGIWGDLGMLGLGAYFYLVMLVWRHVCLTGTAKYLMLTVFVFGMIFSQLEEPGYTLVVSSLIGLDWQYQRIIAKQKLMNVSTYFSN
jgi:hypothetical protein